MPVYFLLLFAEGLRYLVLFFHHVKQLYRLDGALFREPPVDVLFQQRHLVLLFLDRHPGVCYSSLKLFPPCLCVLEVYLDLLRFGGLLVVAFFDEVVFVQLLAVLFLDL